MAIPVPANDAAMQVAMTTNAAASAALDIDVRFSNENSFLCLLERMGCGHKERFRIRHNGFDTAESFVHHYGDKIDDFSKQLKTDNKNWSNANQIMMRSFFTPIVIKRLVGALHYINVVHNLLHKMPDIDDVTAT